MKTAIVIFADTETKEALGRVLNALEFAKELKEHGDDVRIIFDGAAVKWLPEITDSEHYVHPLYKAVEDKVDGACSYCASAFGVQQKLSKLGTTFLDDYDDHPSLRNLMVEGYHIVTF